MHTTTIGSMISAHPPIGVMAALMNRSFQTLNYSPPRFSQPFQTYYGCYTNVDATKEFSYLQGESYMSELKKTQGELKQTREGQNEIMELMHKIRGRYTVQGVMPMKIKT